MSRGARYGTTVAFVLALAVTLGAACGRASSDPGRTDDAVGGTQTNEEGSVTVEVSWDGQLRPLAFDVTLDTHSVELDGYDLARLALLRTDRGDDLKPARWDAPEGGHHRQGALSFDLSAEEAGRLDGASYLELVIRDVAGVPERTFRWHLAGAGQGSR